MDRIVVAFASEEAQRRILRLLASDGWEPAACCASGAEAIRTVRKLGSAIVICGFKLRDMTASGLAADLRSTAVLLVVSSAVNLDMCEGENLYKLATPAARSDFFATLDMLRRFEERRGDSKWTGSSWPSPTRRPKSASCGCWSPAATPAQAPIFPVPT